MFATSVRVSPCSARSSPRSVGRSTTISPSRCSIFIRLGTTCESSPSGPFTCTRPGEIATFTEVGSSIGLFPIRLMALPNETDDLAADAFALGGTARDEPLGGGHDRGAHAAEHARQPVFPSVHAATGLGDALQIGEDPLATPAVLELDDEEVERVAALDAVVLDVALVLEQPCDLDLHFGGRHAGALVECLVGVADPGEHVRDRVGNHVVLLPAALRHAGDRAVVGELPQADPAQAELAEDRTRTPTPVAARVRARLELLRPGLLDHQRLLCHLVLLPLLAGERQAERAQQRERLVVRLGSGRDRDVEPANLGDVVVVDLGKDELLADAERIVSASVERPRVQPTEVANARQRDRHEPVEELPHAVAAERDLRADRHPLADLELRDRLSRLAHLRALPGDDRQLLDRGVELLRVGLRLADAHVERDLGDAGNLHQREAELVLQPAAKLAGVELLEPRLVVGLRRALACGFSCSHHRSISWPQSARLQTRTWMAPPFASFAIMPTRVGRLQTGHTTITLETDTGAAFSMIPPGITCGAPIRLGSFIGFGREWRFTTFRFSTIKRRSPLRTSSTRPCLPRSLPVNICTRSPFFTFSLRDMTTGPPARARRSS